MNQNVSLRGTFDLRVGKTTKNQLVFHVIKRLRKGEGVMDCQRSGGGLFLVARADLALGEDTFAALAGSTAGSPELAVREDDTDRHCGHGDAEEEQGGDECLHVASRVRGPVSVGFEFQFQFQSELGSGQGS